MLLGKDILEAGRCVLDTSSADQVEVVINRERSAFARFAGSAFHQGGSVDGCSVYVRAVLGRKVGTASTNRLDCESMKECLTRAVETARHLKEEPYGINLPSPSRYKAIKSFFDSTSSMTEGEKASLIARGFKKAAQKGVAISGVLSTCAGEIAVLNTKGVEAYHPYTVAHLNAVGSVGEATGSAGALSKDISRIDVEWVAGLAAERCLEARSPVELKPGVYRVYFEPAAVAELLLWLSYTGFGAKNFHDGMSFLSGRLGEKITGSNVTIYDDGIEGISVPFDMEGVPRQRTMLIEKGMARGVVYDSMTAASNGCGTTGNAPFPEETEGPLPDHIFMEAGQTPSSEMAGLLGDGVLVRSFHYVNGLLDPLESMMTGMTRHGTFLVKDGKIKGPVKPLRFTENILKAFGRIEAISMETELFSNHVFPLSSISAPGLLIGGFAFTG